MSRICNEIKSVQNLQSFWRSSQHYFVLALFCVVYTVSNLLKCIMYLAVEKHKIIATLIVKYCQFKYNYHCPLGIAIGIDAVKLMPYLYRNISKTY